MNSTTETKTATGAAIVRAALEARTVAEASQINDMITLHVGKRYERFIGDTANNLGPLTTRGNYDHKALEPLTNMHDAILERFACEKFGGDLSAVPYETPREAAAGLLGHPSREEQAALARVDIYESDPPTKESKRVTLAYRDRGCGIDNAYVSESTSASVRGTRGRASGSREPSAWARPRATRMQRLSSSSPAGPRSCSGQVRRTSSRLPSPSGSSTRRAAESTT